jgi:hypothetical protein
VPAVLGGFAPDALKTAGFFIAAVLMLLAFPLVMQTVRTIHVL